MGVDTAEVARPTAGDGRQRAGKYLTFRLGDEEYGVEIMRVKEIIGLMPITHVPRTPAFIRGVLNLRGKVIPVLDLRRKFAMAAVEDTEFTCIVVVEASLRGNSALMGIVVDTVSEVVDIAAEEVVDPPSFGAATDTTFILGMAKHRSAVKILLNIEAVLSEPGVVEMATAAAQEIPADDAGHSEEG